MTVNDIPVDGEKIIKLEKIVKHVRKTPLGSLASSVNKLIQLINDPLSTSKDLQKIIELDPPLSSNILTVANSAYYYSKKKIGQIDQAIVWLGYNTVREIALNQKISEMFQNDSTWAKFTVRRIWDHSVRVALLNKSIYIKQLGLEGDDAYTIGLLHDIGLIAISQVMPKAFIRINKMLKEENITLIEAEEKIIGINHSEIGWAIAVDWEFPKELAFCIGKHHHPDFRNDNKFLKPNCVIFISDYLCQSVEFGQQEFRKNSEEFFKVALSKLLIRKQSILKTRTEAFKKFDELKEQGVI